MIKYIILERFIYFIYVKVN